MIVLALSRAYLGDTVNCGTKFHDLRSPNFELAQESSSYGKATGETKTFRKDPSILKHPNAMPVSEKNYGKHPKRVRKKLHVDF